MAKDDSISLIAATRDMQRFVACHPFACLSLAVILGIALHCMTLSYSPVCWDDEVEIIELCRGGIANKIFGWSAVFFDEERANHYAWAPWWFGSFWLEMGWKVFGALGPRIVSLCFLVISLIAICAYFHRLTQSASFAAAISFLYFSNPAVIHAVRGVRCESFVFAILFFILYLLIVDSKYSISKYRGGGNCCFVGCTDLLVDYCNCSSAHSAF